ncbi:CoA transferase [Aeromicrobium sp. S22]|uniref:CoA transferase n=1 Tax=Aeromicrobium sp. S22 TaxID=2662029 RepID=UPI001E642E66|nr:CoA transferase [Aeromicrobium sp. S22]
MPDRPGRMLSGTDVIVAGDGSTAQYARDLLTCLGAGDDASDDALRLDLTTAPSPLADWASSGAMALTGRPDGPPLAPAGNPAGAVRAALAVFSLLAPQQPGRTPRLPGVELLGERAAVMGLRRNAPWSCGGAFRTLAASDGSLGLSLPRADDLSMVPALLEQGDDPAEPWAALESWTADRTAAEAAARAQLLGLAGAAVPRWQAPADEQLQHRRDVLAVPGGTSILSRPGGPRRRLRPSPLVVDLTSLWAGPLCAHLLGLAGAEVVKVESTRRPDGARTGPPAFFDLLHQGHAAVALDFTTADGRDQLRRLIESADVVLEASRPRALEQLGIDAGASVDRGTIWTSITAYGRTGPWANRIGFGDDVAAAAGLVLADGEELVPCGDAIADPLTGIIAAVATQAALRGDRAHLIDVSMRDVAASVAGDPHAVTAAIRAGETGWVVQTGDGSIPVAEPSVRRPECPAAAFGHDTAEVLARLGVA